MCNVVARFCKYLFVCYLFVSKYNYRFLPGDLFHIKQFQRDFDYLSSEYQRIIDEHREAAKEGKQDDDFISVYLKKIEEEKNVEGSSFTGTLAINRVIFHMRVRLIGFTV